MRNITISGFNGTVPGVLAPGDSSSFWWQQSYPITTEDIYKTYVNVTVMVNGFFGPATAAIPYSVSRSLLYDLPVQAKVDFSLLPTLDLPGG